MAGILFQRDANIRRFTGKVRKCYFCLIQITVSCANITACYLLYFPFC